MHHYSSRFFTVLHGSSRFFTILHDSSRPGELQQGMKLVDGKSGQSLALPQLLCPGSLLYLGAHGIVRRRSVA
jgi:hypothetical protein